jgi:S1-C subfamily serine protease
MQRVGYRARAETPALPSPPPRPSNPAATTPRSRKKLVIATTSLAVIAVVSLVPTFLLTRSLQAEVDDLRSTVRTLKGRVATAQGEQHSLESSLDHKIESLRWTIAYGDRDRFDASLVIELIDDAVVTVVSGNSQGSGFGLMSSGGESWIATNYHVIADSLGNGAPRVTIRHGSSTWRGVVFRWDRSTDVALIKVDVPMTVLTTAYEAGHPPTIGENVLAYGSPLGLEGSATVGIVSAIRGGWIQTDAQINHGNSGGPLVDSFGEVVGITTAGYGDGSGIGFAVNITILCAELVKGRC